MSCCRPATGWRYTSQINMNRWKSCWQMTGRFRSALKKIQHEFMKDFSVCYICAEWRVVDSMVLGEVEIIIHQVKSAYLMAKGSRRACDGELNIAFQEHLRRQRRWQRRVMPRGFRYPSNLCQHGEAVNFTTNGGIGLRAETFQSDVVSSSQVESEDAEKAWKYRAYPSRRSHRQDRQHSCQGYCRSCARHRIAGTSKATTVQMRYLADISRSG